MPAPTALQRAPEKLAGDVAMTDAAIEAINQDESSAVIDPNAIDLSASTAAAAQHSAQDTLSAPPPISDPLSETQPMFPPATSTITSSERTTSRASSEHKQHQLKGRHSTLPHTETRKIPIPPHRMTPLKASWPKIYPPLVEHLKLQVRMNLRLRAVELRTSRYHHQQQQQQQQQQQTQTSTENTNNHTRSAYYTPTEALQKGDDFLRAISLGFDVDDAIALLRLDDLYIETFEIRDVKPLHGEHLSRAIGRIAGHNGKTKFAIENTSRTRIVLADSKIHILGGFKNIHVAREAVVSLILGAPPGKVYGNLRTVAGRMKERF